MESAMDVLLNELFEDYVSYDGEIDYYGIHFEDLWDAYNAGWDACEAA